jgi:hypothetical protein
MALGDLLCCSDSCPIQQGFIMPERDDEEALGRAREDEQEGKAPSTQAGEFVREEFEHVREGKHGARSPQQAIAIGLSKARRAGIKLPAPKRGRTSARTRSQALRDLRRSKSSRRTSRTRSRAVMGALRREGHRSASHSSIGRQARRAARVRGPASRHTAARRAARTKGQEGLRRAARKAARTRKRRRSRA